MNKKIFAAFLVITFLLGIVLTAMPAMAHTTLGRPTGTDPYAVRDSDTNGIGHVFGATGYVWPGGGKDWYTGALTEPPGYQNPWGSYPADAPLTWWQLRGNTYAPFGAILTSMEDKDNMGDLIFAINFTYTTLRTDEVTGPASPLQVRDAYRGILAIENQVDDEYISSEEKANNYILRLGKENQVKFTISIENVSNSPLDKIIFKKVLPENFYDLEFKSSTSKDFKVSRNSIECSLNRLNIGEKTDIVIAAKIFPKKKENIKTGKFEITLNLSEKGGAIMPPFFIIF